ncbi:MAG: esterase family protein [Pseudomonadota bacterium]|nr:esterase family protein [Pseudomonadota bacterium]
MARKRPVVSPGKVVVLEHVSRVLEGNPLGDPHVRRLAVWLPQQYDEGAGSRRGRRFPVLWDLAGFTGSGLTHLNWRPFDENVPARVARLVHERKMGPSIVVFPDCFTSLGGNQYINSSAIGRYADYLITELIPLIDREFRTLEGRDHRACFGKSSGGYGAMIHGMKYARHWGAIADHSGDALFDFCYYCDWPRTLNELDKYRAPKRKAGPVDVAAVASATDSGLDDGRAQRFLDDVWRREKLNDAEVHALMNLAMAASYDPDPDAPLGFRIPFNLETGELLPQRWRNWQRHDPVNLVARYARNLGTLRGIYIDCGWRDQYHLHYGARMLSQRLSRHGIAHRYEEFDDNHSSIDYRMDVSLPFLYRAIAG